MRERFYERKEKTHIPRRDKGPLGLQRRDEQDGLQEEEKRRTGWWVASPCQHSWWPWPLCFWLQTLRRPLLVLTLLWHLLAISSSLFWGGIPMFYVGIRQQHFSTFMYLGWDSTPCLKWRMSSELSKECTKLPPYCAGFKEELTNPSTCAGTTGEKKCVFSFLLEVNPRESRTGPVYPLPTWRLNSSTKRTSMGEVRREGEEEKPKMSEGRTSLASVISCAKGFTLTLIQIWWHFLPRWSIKP